MQTDYAPNVPKEFVGDVAKRWTKEKSIKSSALSANIRNEMFRN